MAGVVVLWVHQLAARAVTHGLRTKRACDGIGRWASRWRWSIAPATPSTGRWRCTPTSFGCARRRTRGRRSRPTRYGRARRPLRQLAAGSVRQLPGPVGVPDPRPQPDHHRRSDRRHEGDQPVRLLHRGVRRDGIRFDYPNALAEDLKPYLRPVDEDAEGSGPGDLDAAWVKDFSVAPGTRTIDFLVALNRAVNADVGYSVRMEPGVQTPDHTLRTGHRLLPRLGVAAGVDPAPAAASPPASCPATWSSSTPTSRRSTGRRARPPTSPTCTPGPRCTSPARAGSAWTRPRPCSPARATSRCPRRRTRRRRRRSPGATEPCETTLDFSNVVTRVHEDPRVTLPYTEAAWGGHLRARRARRRAAGRRRRRA